MSSIFTEVFYRPILNLLLFLYDIIPGGNLGVAIIALTFIIKLALYPLSQKMIKSQKALQDLNPKMEEIKQKYKDDKEAMGREMMNLYKESKVNPFSSCLPLLIQFPFLIAVFRVLRAGLSETTLALAYSFIHIPENINTMFLGLNLEQRSVLLAILAGAAQFWQAKMMSTKRPPIKTEGSQDEDMAAIMNKQMTYFFPIITVMVGLSLPSGLTLYWLATTVFTGLQQLLVFRKKKDEEQQVIDNK